MYETIHSHSISVLGVVPVFVNTGAALLPAILAGLASVLGLLFKPRELFRLCLRKPWVPLLIIAVAVGGYFLISAALAAANAPSEAAGNAGRRPEQTATGDSNWAAVALELIRREERNWQQAWLEERDKRKELEKRLAELEARLGRAADEDSSVDQPSNVPLLENSQGESLRHGEDEAVIYRGGAARYGYGGGSPLQPEFLWQTAVRDRLLLNAGPAFMGNFVGEDPRW